MHVVAATGAGFLLAVLWFDLMFDTQVVRHREGDLPAEVRDSIAAYYGRVTTAARPMNRFIAAVMLITIAALIGEIVQADVPVGIAWTSLALALVGIGLAAARTVRNAVRLGTQADTSARQSALARAVFRDHIVSLVAIAALIALQLVAI